MNANGVVDQAARFGGLPTANPTYASAPITLTSVVSDASGQPSGQPASYALSLTPQNGFTGAVIFNCTPVNPGQYATCSLLPSSVSITNATAQTSTATINTVTETTSALRSGSLNRVAICVLPGILVVFCRRRATLAQTLFIFLISATFLTATACGSGGNVTINNGNPNLRYTPPGTYQYQVTASSVTGVQLSQTVTLNLTVTSQ